MNSTIPSSEKRALLTIEDGVASIVLNGARNGNAINVALAKDLKEALHRCEQQKDVRAVLLSGTGASSARVAIFPLFINVEHRGRIMFRRSCRICMKRF